MRAKHRQVTPDIFRFNQKAQKPRHITDLFLDSSPESNIKGDHSTRWMMKIIFILIFLYLQKPERKQNTFDSLDGRGDFELAIEFSCRPLTTVACSQSSSRIFNEEISPFPLSPSDRFRCDGGKAGRAFGESKKCSWKSCISLLEAERHSLSRATPHSRPLRRSYFHSVLIHRHGWMSTSELYAPKIDGRRACEPAPSEPTTTVWWRHIKQFGITRSGEVVVATNESHGGYDNAILFASP